MEDNSLKYRGMTVGNILDYTFQVYGRNFRAILCFSALVAGIFYLLYNWAANAIAIPGMTNNPWEMILEALETGDIGSIVNNPSAIDGTYGNIEWVYRSFILQGVIGLMSILYAIFVTPLVQGGITGIAYQYAHGNKLDIGSAYRLSLKKYWRMVVTSLCLGLYYLGIGIVIFIISLIFMIPIMTMGIIMGNSPQAASIVGFIVMLVFMLLVIVIAAVIGQMFVSFTFPVVMGENVFHFNAMGRSFKLVGKKFWKVLGVTLLITLIVCVMMLILGVAAFVLMMTTRSALAAQQFFAFLNTALVLPISYIAFTVLYMDVRRQVEGSNQ